MTWLGTFYNSVVSHEFRPASMKLFAGLIEGEAMRNGCKKNMKTKAIVIMILAQLGLWVASASKGNNSSVHIADLESLLLGHGTLHQAVKLLGEPDDQEMYRGCAILSYERNLIIQEKHWCLIWLGIAEKTHRIESIRVCLNIPGAPMSDLGKNEILQVFHKPNKIIHLRWKPATDNPGEDELSDCDDPQAPVECWLYDKRCMMVVFEENKNRMVEELRYYAQLSQGRKSYPPCD